MNWLWEHVALPTLGAFIEHIPWWGWAAILGVVCALAWKTYKFLGWPGVAGIALAALTFGAYRQGWLNAVQSHKMEQFETPRVSKSRPTIFDKGVKPKRRYNADLNIWE